MQPTYSGVVHGCSFERSRGYDPLVNISAAERVGHYPHPRPVVERNDKEVRVLLSKSRIACEGYRSHAHRIQNMVCDDLPELMQSKGRGEQHVNSRVARLPG